MCNSLMWYLVFYESKLGYNAVIVTKKKKHLLYESEGTVDHSKVTRCFKKFCLVWKKLDNLERSDRSKIVDSEAMLQVI